MVNFSRQVNVLTEQRYLSARSLDKLYRLIKCMIEIFTVFGLKFKGIINSINESVYVQHNSDNETEFDWNTESCITKLLQRNIFCFRSSELLEKILKKLYSTLKRQSGPFCLTFYEIEFVNLNLHRFFQIINCKRF